MESVSFYVISILLYMLYAACKTSSLFHRISEKAKFTSMIPVWTYSNKLSVLHCQYVLCMPPSL